MQTQNKLHFSFIYIICSAVFFSIGLTVCYALPSGSFLYQGLQNSIINNILNCSYFSLSAIVSSFLGETKYFFFALIATFTLHRHLIFTCLVSYKGFLTGTCSACLIRTVKYGNINAKYEVVGCLISVLLAVAVLCILCLFCSYSLIYSKKLVYPLRFKSLIKRKDTYLFLINFFSVCGAVFILVLFKHGNLNFMIY